MGSSVQKEPLIGPRLYTLAQQRVMAEALAWYAERRNYAPAFGDRVPTDGIGMVGVRDSYDGNGPGARARAALAYYLDEVREA